MDALMQRCNIRISNYVSTVDSKSYRDIVTKITEGETRATELVKEVHGRTINRCGRDTIVAALDGVIRQTDIDLLKQYKEELDMLRRHKAECLLKMREICEEHFKDEFERLQTVPGVSGQSAMHIIAELGVDMSTFQTPAMLVGWAGLKPRNDESNGKFKSRKTTHGNKYLRKTLIEVSWPASKKKGCFYNKFSYHQIVVRRKGKLKVQVAIARKILVAIWNILSKGIPYIEYAKVEET